MSTEELGKKGRAIRSLVARLVKVGPMRPGTLTVQYRHPAERRSPFYQLSYTHKGRSRSEYVRPESLPAIRGELAAYKTFRRLISAIIDLSLEASQLRHKRH